MDEFDVIDIQPQLRVIVKALEKLLVQIPEIILSTAIWIPTMPLYCLGVIL